MTTENKTLKLTLDLTAEEWAILRKAIFRQSEHEEEEAIKYRKRSNLMPETVFYSNYAKIHGERYLVIKEAKDKIDDAFKNEHDLYWHNVEHEGDSDTKQKLSITDED